MASLILIYNFSFFWAIVWLLGVWLVVAVGVVIFDDVVACWDCTPAFRFSRFGGGLAERGVDVVDFVSQSEILLDTLFFLLSVSSSLPARKTLSLKKFWKYNPINLNSEFDIWLKILVNKAYTDRVGESAVFLILYFKDN